MKLTLAAVLIFGLPALCSGVGAAQNAPPHRDCLVLGATLGTPAVLNGEIGYWRGRLGARGSGMYWGGRGKDRIYGFQINLDSRISGRARLRHHGVGLAAGLHHSFSDLSGPYIGVAYHLLLGGGFFLELGPAYRFRSGARGIWTFKVGYLRLLELGS